ncbi:Transmembrane_domain-containing protein [Hexamita inflata]|uniref:Transmembrane_domain-containing protein n=1 Tax=Hexamita inflata TaxID=28002 RepID=A0ABP1HWB2_9EUKA
METDPTKPESILEEPAQPVQVHEETVNTQQLHQPNTYVPETHIDQNEVRPEVLDNIDDESYVEKKVRKPLTYKNCHMISFIMDMVNAVVFIVEMCLFKTSSDFVSVEHNSSKVSLYFVMLIINHVPGTFPFLLVYLPLSCTPPSDLIHGNIPSMVLQYVEALTMFVSMSFKYWGKTMVNEDPQKTWMVEFLGIKPNNVKSDRLNTIMNNSVSMLSQAVLFAFLFKGGKINYLLLYLLTPGLFLWIFIFSYVAQNLINNNKAKYKSNLQFVKQMFNFVMTNAFIFMLLGICVAAIINGIFALWDSLAKWCAAETAKTQVKFPSFSPSSAMLTASIFTSFSLSFGGSFALYLPSSCAHFVQKMTAVKYEAQIKKSKVAEFTLLFVALFQHFVYTYRNIFITSIIIVGIQLTSCFSDFVQLGFLLSSGVLISGAWSTVLHWLMFFVSWGLIASYMFMIYKSYKQPRAIYGVASFLLGMIAIPSILSIDLIKSLLVQVFPCALQSTINDFITTSVIPATAVISLLQAAPVMFRAQCQVLRHGEEQQNYQEQVEKHAHERAFLQQLQLDEDTHMQYSEIEEEPVKLAKFIAEDAFKASKYASASFQDVKPREKRRVLPESTDKQVQRLSILVERTSQYDIECGQSVDTIHVGVTGTHSLLNLGVSWFTKAIPDWCRLAFGPNVELDFDGQKSFVNYSLLKRAQRISDLLSQVISDKQKIVLSGHHSGAAVSLLTAYILHQKKYEIEVYAFGCPHVFGQQFMNYLTKNVSVHLLELGLDSKLYLSAIMTNQLKYVQAVQIGFSNEMDNLKGQFAILNAGGSKDVMINAMKGVVEGKNK